MASLKGTRLTALAGGAVFVLCAGCGSGHSRLRSAVPEDTVATGYGKEPSTDFSGAVTSVSTEKLPTPSSIEQWLATRVPGLEVLHLPNGDFTVQIHGANSFMMNTEPLVVIDGTALPPGGGLRSVLGSLNPSDIAKIDVLKEGGATAIYGVRGGNGVIVITTRRGQAAPKRP